MYRLGATIRMPINNPLMECASTLLEVPLQKEAKGLSTIGEIKAGLLEKNDINQLVITLNDLIATYNAADNTSEKIALLKRIQNEMDAIDNKYMPTQIAASIDYLDRHSELFKEIKAQEQHLGIHALVDRSPNASLLTSIIENMQPEKADLLSRI